MLAPMRSLTQGPLWMILNAYGAPDAYVSEFVRVHENFTLDPQWVEKSLMYAAACPLWIQLMGNDAKALARNVKILQQFPIAGIDFNVGCPAPKIFKKQAGGGLLRNLTLLNDLVCSLRQSCQKPLSVKIRLGFDNTDVFEKVLDILSVNGVDLITIHARTVQEGYTGTVRYEFIKRAVQSTRMPIVANGSINSLAQVRRVLYFTDCHGVMLGRAAVRNPWIFAQWRNTVLGKSTPCPCYQDVFAYLQKIYESFKLCELPMHLGRMKQFCCYICPGIDPQNLFLKQVLSCEREVDFWFLCEKWLLKNECGKKLFNTEVEHNFF